MILHHTATREGKVLSFLRRELQMSSALVSKLKFRNAYFLDGEPVFTDQKVAIGQEITVHIEESPQEEFPPEDLPLSILYEDESLLLVDKPAGLVVHPTWNRLTGTLLNRVAGYYVKTGQKCAVHPVNRLDRDTKGVVLLAKNAHVHALLYGMQRAGKFLKTYHALCCGAPPEKQGQVDAPIRRAGENTMLRCVSEDGAPALTEYQVLEEQDGLCRMELMPITGRTHQLRVHCQYLGCPILGDSMYFTEESERISRELGFVGQALTAYRLSFPHPMTGEMVTVESRQDIFLPNS